MICLIWVDAMTQGGYIDHIYEQKLSDKLTLKATHLSFSNLDLNI